ncbi:molybdopterin-dependent oxidoreductase [Sulfurimonas lithotrophica]|uniref:Molybdopterin-dependent oxidoreductase n=1 Tax=Sulfurimonas lithotrophica TaxID=2590022 RepID=A0A5P8P195_9BACT|nr:molybdopterin-dependent oxidoreductase [Sulfurimonas lithotrophica]QFR49469.1 molybdopterin-dependent oxidoreductase [Sulfurimonas lithotrophica]
MNNTACPLDCYDACEIIYEDHKIKAKKSGHTRGFLCPHLNHYEKNQQIQSPRYKGVEISMDEALLKLKELIELGEKNEILHYRGSGNFALMQGVTDHFFASYGATLTEGSLCDGAGEAGIIEGRGSNKNMPLSQIAKSEVVILWGRNPHTTSSHLLPLLKDKQIVVIDPVKTKAAKISDLYIQIQPRGDLELAMLLSRFLHIEHGCDEQFLEEYASEAEDFYELTQNIRIKAVLDKIGVTLGDIGDILAMVKGKKVAIVCGIGVQKYRNGSEVIRAIDAFATNLGLFGKEGSGVAYLGNSKEAIESPFNTKAKRVSKVDTKFSDFKTVFIQGANPLSQMPNSSRVVSDISKVENVVYFGLYENETSEAASLVIPAKSFLYKNDIRTSYSHNAMISMHKQKDTDIGISEYDLSKFLCKEFGIEIKSEDDYIKHFKNFSVQNIDGAFYVENREDIPYKEGFDTDDNEFVFLDEFEVHDYKEEKLFLITSKSPKSLNSQFNREENVYLNSSLGFAEGDLVEIESSVGNVKLKVKINNDLRNDCVLIYSGTKGVNNLTSSLHSYEGKNAIFQEEMVVVKSI